MRKKLRNSLNGISVSIGKQNKSLIIIRMKRAAKLEIRINLSHALVVKSEDESTPQTGPNRTNARQ